MFKTSLKDLQRVTSGKDLLLNFLKPRIDYPMQEKIKKFIQNTPKEDLKSFLDGYDLNLPKDFRWRICDSKYNNELFHAILNISDDQKDQLFEIIERTYEMTDELGQVSLQSQPLTGSSNNFLSLKSEISRCIWALQNHPVEFHKAEYHASCDYQRKSRQWSCFIAPKTKEINNSKEQLEEFKHLALQHLNISHKIKVDLFNQIKTNHHGKEIITFHLLAYYDGLPRSIQTFEKEEVVTKFISSVNEFSISYEPDIGVIEVTSNSKENHIHLAKVFANSFLKTAAIDSDKIKIKRYNFSKFKSSYDFMKDVDAFDLIDDIKVTLLKLRSLNSRNSTTIESPYTNHWSIYDLANEWFLQSDPLSNSYFEISKVRLSIKFKPSHKKPHGEILHIVITNPNGCDLKDRSEKQKLIVNKYFERWGLVQRT